MKLKIAVVGLRMGQAWANAAANDIPDAELTMVYDKHFDENPRIDHKFYATHPAVRVVAEESEIYHSDCDIVVIASPDHFHTEQCIRALEAGKHVACEKPLAPTVADCRKIIAAVKKSGRYFMTGQVCRYAPGFKLAKYLLDSGRIGSLVVVESEYAHDYSSAGGYLNWRFDPVIKRQGFLGGGCHALDLTRWLAGEPESVFCTMNHEYLPNCPTPDTGIAVIRFGGNVIGRVFVSTGVKRPYTMRTVIYGTRGTIICDNTSDHIQVCETSLCDVSGALKFSDIPVNIASHNVASELTEFVACVKNQTPPPTDVYQGSATVAFAEAAIRSATSGKVEVPETFSR